MEEEQAAGVVPKSQAETANGRESDSERPTPTALGGWALLALSLLTAVAWASAPAMLRHLGHEEPLFEETVRLESPEPAGGLAYRAELETTPGAERWAPGWTRVLEDGRELERVSSGREVRERAGTYTAVTRGEESFVLFSPGDGRDPRASSRRTSVRRPREISPDNVRLLLILFAALSVAAPAAVFVGLRRAGLVAAAGPIALATLSGVLTLVLLEGRLPESSADLLGEKLRQYAAVEDEIDTVFLGSSRVYRHLDPETFDAVFAEHGRSARSFNLGVPDMRILETLTLAQRLLERSPAIRRLIVEAESNPLFIREENRATQRVRRWHGLGTLRRAIPAILAEDAPWPETTLAVLDRLELFFWRASQIGRGLDVVDAALSRVEARPARWIEPERRGFLSLDAERRAPRTEAAREGLERRWSELHDAVPRWRQTLAQLRRSSPAGHETDRFELERFAELERLAAQHDVELVFVLSPRPERRPNLVHAAESGIVGRLVRFDDPDRYPRFYALEGRYDRHHLDEEAAREMTRLLALELLGERDTAEPRTDAEPETDEEAGS